MKQSSTKNESGFDADKLASGLNVYADRALSRLQHLYEISKLLTNIESVEITAPAIFECMTNTLPLRTAVIVQKREEAIETAVWAIKGISTLHKNQAEQRAKESIKALLEGTFTSKHSVSNAEESKEATLIEPKEQENTFIFIPLVVRKSPIFGALQIEIEGDFTEEDLTFINTLANQLAMALHRHFLWQTEIIMRKLAEKTIAKTADDLTIQNTELENFAAVASHDLNEPLRTLTAFIALLQRRNLGKLDQESQDYMTFVVDGAKRMRALIDDLLRMSSVAVSREDAQCVDLNDVLRNVLLNLQLSIEECSAKVSVDLLPSVLGYSIQLGQLFQNLISNALKYHKKGAPYVHISCEKKDENWLFMVKDNGIGIEMQYAKRIFEPFKRLHGKDSYPGSGLGLAVCKKIVERHGGKIWVDSVPEKGSTFCFSLPVVSCAVDEIK